MSNWKRELYLAIRENDYNKSDFILNLSQVKSELPFVKEWKLGESPIHEAAFQGFDTILRKLLENGANPNAYLIDDKEYFLPIHEAVLNDKISSVELLIKFGADHTLEGYFEDGNDLNLLIKLLPCQTGIQ